MSLRLASLLKLSLCLGFGAFTAHAQNNLLACQPTVNPILVRGEGLAERMGDIVLQCAGGPPNSSITGNLSVFLSVPITNRVDGSGFTDLQLTIDNGAGPVPANTRAAYLNASNLSFNGLSFNLSSTGGVTIRLSNLRGAANQAGVDSHRQITASLSFTGGSLLSIFNNIFPVGTTARSLYSSSTSQLICSQYGTPPISSSSFAAAISSQASFSTIRVSEGFGSAFGPHSDFNFVTGDFGTRLMVRFSGVTPGIHIYVPDGIVGTDGRQPTSAGEYGLAPSGGTYIPGSGTLLLLRVATSDVNGGGRGSGPIIPVPTRATTFDSMNEVSIGADGIGRAIYEVFDANPFAVESATIPAFVYVPPNVVTTLTQVGEDVVLAPSSTTFETTANATVPRFAPVVAPNDCAFLGDCRAFYFPHMSVDATSFDVSMTSLDTVKDVYFTISKSGTGHYIWNASVVYTGGANGSYQWLKLFPTSGVDRETPRVSFVPGTLPPGVYNATIIVDGGPVAGTIQIPVTLRLSYQAPLPVVTSAVNPANMKAGVLVAGSTVAIVGDRLTGNQVSVTFDGVAARVLSTVSPNRVDVLVPDEAAAKDSSLVVVKVDGNSSTPGFKVPIGAAAPAIFGGLILNGDATTNNPQNAAVTGSTIQVFVSGLPTTGVYSGQIHDRAMTNDQLVYAGPAPGMIGVQMVSMVVPVDLPSMTTGVLVCGGATADALTCSDQVDLTIQSLPSDPPDFDGASNR